MANNDPNNLSDIIDILARFIPPSQTGVFGFTDPLFVSEFATNPSFSGRIKAYTGTLANKKVALTDDGFTTDSPTYRQVVSGGQQKGPPQTIYVGRKDALDADWPAALDAIKVQAIADGLGYYAIACDTRDPFDIEDIETWTDGQFAFYLAQTNSAGVIQNLPGNVAANILAKARLNPRTAIVWHDPAVASNLGGAVLTSGSGDFNVADGATLTLRVDGGLEQAFDFNAAAAFVLGSNTEPFVFADLDSLVFSVDGGVTQTVVFTTSSGEITSNIAETYDIVPNSQLSVRVDGGAVESVTFAGAFGSVSTAAQPYNINVGETVEIAVDGGVNQLFTFAIGEITPGAATASEVSAAFDAFFVGTNIANTGVAVEIASQRAGNSSDIEIIAGGTALVALGLVAGNNAGSGFGAVAFLDTVTAAEVATQINLDTTGSTSSDSGGFVKITADSIGTDSRIQVSGGSANSVFQFDTNESPGEGDFKDATAVEADEVIEVLVDKAQFVVPTNEAGAVQLTSRRLGEGSFVAIIASTAATTLGLAVGTAQGSGDFFDAANAKSGEISTHIGLTLLDAVATTASNRVVLTTVSTGAAAELEITGGTLAPTLNFTDSAGNSNRARGTGTDEDYLDCAWIGRCITFDLDAPNGAAVWDDHHLEGVFADTVITEQQRFTLEETLKVNTYRNRNGRDETHTGTLCNDILGGGRYIDVLTTLDWFKTRTVEDWKRFFDGLADIKRKSAYSDSGAIAELVNIWRQRHVIAETNGHFFFQDKTLDPDDPDSLGIFTPTVASQTEADKQARLIAGFQTRQPIQAAAQRAKATIELVGPQG